MKSDNRKKTTKFKHKLLTEICKYIFVDEAKHLTLL